MRAGPLSNSKIIGMLNTIFVPVYASNVDLSPTGSASAEEKAERQRIYVEFLQAKMGAGDVFIYILTPDGHPANGIDIGRAQETDRTIEALEETIHKMNLRPGRPIIKPTPQSRPPKRDAGSMLFHLSARGSSHGSWRQFPSENWIVLSPAEWGQLLPRGEVEVGASWEPGKALTTRLLTNFYPQTEETTLADRNRIERQSLKFTVTSVENGKAQARIDGSLRMRHSFYPGKPDENGLVTATMVGFMEFDPVKRKVERLQLVTEKARYIDEEFLAALRFMTPDALAFLGLQ